jgi:outer membrane protein assembly factor BamB
MRIIPIVLVLSACAGSVDTDTSGDTDTAGGAWDLATPDAGEWPMFKRSLDHRGLAADLDGAINADNVCVKWEAALTGPKTRGAGGPIIAKIGARWTVFAAVDGNCADDGSECRSGYGDRAVPGKVWAIDGASGDVVWTHLQDEPLAQFDPYAPLVADIDADGARELVVPSTDTRAIFAFDAASGDPRWEFDLPDGHVSEGAPAAANLDDDPALEIVIGDDAQGAEGDRAALYAIDGATGTQDSVLAVPSRGDRDDGCKPLAGQKFDSSQPAIATVDGRTLIFSGAWNGSYYALDWDGGLQIAWEFAIPENGSLACGIGKVRSSAVVADLDADGSDEVSFGWMYQEDQESDPDEGSRYESATLQTLDAATGAPKADLVLGDWKSSPSAADLVPGEPGLELAAGHLHGVYAAKSNLALAWDRDPAGSDARGNRSSPAIADIDGDGDLDVIVATEGDGDQGDIGLYAYDGATGDLLWSVPFGGDGEFYVGASSSPAVGDIDGDGQLEVVVLGADGLLRAIDGGCE